MRSHWLLRGRRKYLAAVLLAADLGVGMFSTAMAVSGGHIARPQVAVTTTTSTATTVSWTDNRNSFDSGYVDNTTLDPHDPNQPLFKNLQVTVSQTQNLTDQGLSVSWTGGTPTSTAGAASDYLQIMQCWAGKGQAGPTPQQCQWGTPNASLASATGTAAATRDLLTGAEADPQQSLGAAYTHPIFGQAPLNAVPFWSVDDPTKKNLTWSEDANDAPPFNVAQSNEVTVARTGANGTGQYIVDLQSALSAPYLGCGSSTSTANGDTCWLVVVPRGEYNLNGESAADQQFNPNLGQNPTYVAGSPLSASAWQDRMQVKLSFTPIGANCKLGEQETNTAGSELVSQAFSSWQAPLCTAGKNFSYSEIGDSEAKTDIVSGGTGLPTLGFMSSPIDSPALSGSTVDYAPVTTSAITVSYLIDKSYTADTANPDIGTNGNLVTDLRLDPQLVAKLLTQSYRNDTPGDGSGKGATVASGNPDSLRQDPEFYGLNPEFAYFHPSSAPDGLIVPFGDSDAAHLVWNWICSDSQARQFLGGAPDHWGTTVNSAYLALHICNSNGTSDFDSFPKADPSTYIAPTNGSKPPTYGSLDLRPYSADFGDGAVRTVNAKSGSKIFWDETLDPSQFTGGTAQTPGSRFEMAITTSQAASLYGLPVATLVPGDSDSSTVGVQPTTAAMQAQLAADTPTDVSGVNEPSPGTYVKGGYPLTMQTYAAVNVCAASTSDLTAYASLLHYAATAGQVSGTKLGQLPPGYAPLSSTQQSEATATADALQAEVAKPQCASHKPSKSTGSTTGSSTGSSGSTGATDGSGGNAPAGGAAGAGSPQSGTPVTQSVAVVAGGLTPSADITPAARYALLAALCFALPCLIGGPVMVTSARRMR
ncbi:MAG TPA: hypothetical protein VFE15_12280 [Marmoricola sp.]|jgi:hypothetical protein|nr:hypothetical protein [Marmoricola sp.]